MHKGLYWIQLIMGIGIGLIVAALIWMFTLQRGAVVTTDSDQQIVYYNRNDFSLTTSEPATSAEAERFANLFSTNVTAEADSLSDTAASTTVSTGVTAAESNANLEQTPNTASAPAYPNQATSSTPTAGAPTQAAPMTGTTSTNTTQANTTAAPAGATSNTIDFVINKGDSTESVAAKLEMIGVCKSKEFLEKIYRLDLDRYIKAGRHQLTKGLSIDEIIRLIIN